jgi:hypothetical protein
VVDGQAVVGNGGGNGGVELVAWGGGSWDPEAGCFGRTFVLCRAHVNKCADEGAGRRCSGTRQARRSQEDIPTDRSV